MNILESLFQHKDEKYRQFNSSLIPNIEKEKFIGVRTPQLKSLAKELYESKDAEEFLSSLPHYYFEENQLHIFLIAEEKDFDKCLELVIAFLPYIDNCATCDQLTPKCFYKNSEKLIPHIDIWLNSKNTYEIRFGILCLMRYFLGDNFKPEYAQRVLKIQSQEYYIKMMVSWYFATALSTNWDEVFPIIQNKSLSKWTHNKTIQKAKESFRIDQEKKEILKNYIIK